MESLESIKEVSKEIKEIVTRWDATDLSAKKRSAEIRKEIKEKFPHLKPKISIKKKLVTVDIDTPLELKNKRADSILMRSLDGS